MVQHRVKFMLNNLLLVSVRQVRLLILLKKLLLDGFGLVVDEMDEKMLSVKLVRLLMVYVLLQLVVKIFLNQILMQMDEIEQCSVIKDML